MCQSIKKSHKNLMTKFKLTLDQINTYKKQGFLSPIEVLSEEEVSSIKAEIELIEKKWPKQINGTNRNNIHYFSPIFDELVHNKKILDVIENFIGSDILVAGTCLFLKEPENQGFVSWHQDGKYQGWEPYNFLTAWIAITEVTEKNGCVRMLPGSHKKDFMVHKDTFDENNLLTRGQTIENVSYDKTVPILLKPGQLSIHHPKTIHGSGPNLSKKRRIGFAIQSYISTNVKQKVGKVYVQLARGQDNYNFHEHTNRPKKRMNIEDLNLRDKANLELKKILYKNSNKIGKY